MSNTTVGVGLVVGGGEVGKAVGVGALPRKSITFVPGFMKKKAPPNPAAMMRNRIRTKNKGNLFPPVGGLSEEAMETGGGGGGL